jgi:DNA repair protein REV1
VQVYRIFFESSAKVQPVSVDEAYLEYPAGTDGCHVAAELRRQIMAATQCPASVGIGYNMITARLATKKVLFLRIASVHLIARLFSVSMEHIPI